MCKSNYVADNVEKVQHFLIEILNRSSVEEVCVILKHILEFEPYPLEQFLSALSNFTKPLVKERWLVSKLWILLLGEGKIQELAIHIWNKNGFSLRNIFSFTEREDDSLVSNLNSDDASIFESCS
jgi:hypothetical protein